MHFNDSLLTSIPKSCLQGPQGIRGGQGPEGPYGPDVSHVLLKLLLTKQMCSAICLFRMFFSVTGDPHHRNCDPEPLPFPVGHFTLNVIDCLRKSNVNAAAELVISLFLYVRRWDKSKTNNSKGQM